MKNETDKPAKSVFREDSIEILRQLREELIKHRTENDELRKEIRELKFQLANRHLLFG